MTTKMNFTGKEFEKFQTLDELEKEIFSEDEIKNIHTRALKRSKARNEMTEAISKALIQYMAENHLGFNQFKKQLHMSSATLSKILKGNSNLTLDTIAEISEVTGLKIDLHIGSTY